MALIFSAPPVSPPVTVAQWFGVGVKWIGPDGSVWDLADPAGGVVLELDGVEGLHFPPITKYSSTSRAFPGKRQRGWQAAAREAFWRVGIWADGSDAWLDVYNRFFATIHPENEGTWQVTAGSSTRSLQLTGVFSDTYRYVRDPLRGAWAEYPITLEAARPYWQGEPVTRGPWSNGTPENFYSDESGHLFFLSQSATLGSALMDNPGDVDAFPVWTIVGPLSSVEAGVGDQVIDVPFGIADGDTLVIDTDPRNVTARMGDSDLMAEDPSSGDDVSGTLGFQPFAAMAIPPGENIPIQVAGTGAGSVSCSLVPLYFRAF